VKPEGLEMTAHAAMCDGLLRPGEVFWAMDVAAGRRVRVRVRHWFGEAPHRWTLEDTRTREPLFGCLVPILAVVD
jgi:hypothetical protein